MGQVDDLEDRARIAEHLEKTYEDRLREYIYFVGEIANDPSAGKWQQRAQKMLGFS